MAQLLSKRHSSSICLNIVYRALRLCRQVNGAEKYAKRIKPFLDRLEEKNHMTIRKIFEKETAYDDVVLGRTDLSNSIRTLFENSRQYDRNNQGRSILQQLFPGGKITSSVYIKMGSLVDVAEKLIAQLSVLEADHVLKKNSISLKTNLDKIRANEAIYNEAVRQQKMAKNEEVIAREELCQQYEFNYLDMAREFGKAYANRLFPIIVANSSTKTGD